MDEDSPNAFPHRNTPGMDFKDYVAARIMVALVQSAPSGDLNAAAVTAYEAADALWDERQARIAALT